MTMQIVTQNTTSSPTLTMGHTVTMSSREIAGLVESRHDDVKRSIDRLVERGVIVQPPLADEQSRDSLGRQRTTSVYLIGKRDSYIIVAQLSPEFTARLVDRWQELEEKQAAALPDFTNPAEAARAWADQVEAKQEAVLQLEHAKPAVQFVDKYVDGSGLKGFRQVCKLLNANESRFREFLCDAKVMYRLGGEWVPYQPHIDAGRFVTKTGINNTNGRAFNEAKFTPKGINWIAGEWAKHQIQIEVA